MIFRRVTCGVFNRRTADYPMRSVNRAVPLSPSRTARRAVPTQATARRMRQLRYARPSRLGVATRGAAWVVPRPRGTQTGARQLAGAARRRRRRWTRVRAALRQRRGHGKITRDPFGPSRAASDVTSLSRTIQLIRSTQDGRLGEPSLPIWSHHGLRRYIFCCRHADEAQTGMNHWARRWPPWQIPQVEEQRVPAAGTRPVTVSDRCWTSAWRLAPNTNPATAVATAMAQARNDATRATAPRETRPTSRASAGSRRA